MSFNLALLACIRQDKADVLEALLPQVEHIDNVITYIFMATFYDHDDHHKHPHKQRRLQTKALKR